MARHENITPAAAGTPAAEDPRWAQVLQREQGALFFYAVTTTGIYCRPSCTARRPRAANALIFDTAEDAAEAGFRPCRLCQPNDPEGHRRRLAIVAICRFVDKAGDVPSLAALAQEFSMSPGHLHRLFKRELGLTPRQYAQAKRHQRLQQQLGMQSSVTDAVYAAGFNSSGRFYEASDSLLGMTPGAFRAGGRGAEIGFALGQSSLGTILVAGSQRGVCAITLGADAEHLVQALRARFANATLVEGDNRLKAWVAAAVAFAEEPALGLDLPLDIRGTAFQHRVWQALQAIPCGTTATYAEVAQRLGQPTAARAVARACAQNDLALAIPCHRVIRSDGGLSGYRWGVERKQLLLEREAKAGERGEDS